MPTPSQKRPPITFSNLPDPDTMDPVAREALLSTPWFQQVMHRHMSGITVTPELMNELASKPGAQGYKVEEFELQPGKKSRGLIDIATGEMVSPDKLRVPDFEPTIKALKDPTTGQTSSVLMTSPSSAVPFNKAEKQAPMMQNFYKATPVFDENMQVIANVYIGPDGETKTVTKGNDMGALMGLLGGQPGAAKPAAPAPSPNAPAQPAAATAQNAQPALVVKTAEDYARVPSGTAYIDPNGKRRIKK